MSEISSSAEIKVKIKETEIGGISPIVIMGPNGSGKSQLGSEIVTTNSPSDRISAKRMVIPPDQLHFQSEQQAQQEYNNQKNQYRTNLYQYASEFGTLLFKLFAEDAAAAISFRDESISTGEVKKQITPQVTKFMKIQGIWSRVFPQRRIAILKNGLRVSSTLHSEKDVEYQASRMSDGELVAFYMIARVIDAEAGVLVIDEPELHLHSVLARKLWDVLENCRPDIRFIYITHELNFAESRRDATYIVLRPKSEPEVIQDRNSLPPDIFMHLLGAASASVTSDKVIFCEGEPGSFDERFYRAWTKNNSISIIPAGGCQSVISCFEVVQSGKLLRNLKAIAVVDRDDRCDEEIQHLKSKGIFVIDYSEIESLLVSKEMFEAVAAVLHEAEWQKKYDEFIEKSKASATPSLNARTLERCKRIAEWRMYSHFRAIKCDQNIDEVKKNFIAVCTDLPTKIEPDKVFQTEYGSLQKELKDSRGLLRFFPGKTYWKHAGSVLGVTAEKYFELACKILSAEKTDPVLFSVQTKLEGGLSKELFSRTP